MKKIDIHTHLPKDDPEMEGYLSIMDRFEVVAALVHAVPAEGRDNADVLRAVKAHPERLFGSVHVDLREPVEECIDLVREYAARGFRSVKLFPNMGFDANDEHLEPFWAVVEELGLMCLPHCGWLLHRKERAQARLDSLTATPFHFEVPARRHEGVRFIFGHFGGAASYLETIVLCSRLPNAFADTCPGWGRWVFQNRLPGLASLDFAHVLYGTDNAGERYGEDAKWWTETHRAMGRTEEDIERYFYGNAARLLELSEA